MRNIRKKKARRSPVTLKAADSGGELIPAREPIPLSPGETVRIAREMLGWSQLKLAEVTHIPQAALSGIENGKIQLGADRAKVLAAALEIHPSVILFGNWAEEMREIREKVLNL